MQVERFPPISKSLSAFFFFYLNRTRKGRVLTVNTDGKGSKPQSLQDALHIQDRPEPAHASESR